MIHTKVVMNLEDVSEPPIVEGRPIHHANQNLTVGKLPNGTAEGKSVVMIIGQSEHDGHNVVTELSLTNFYSAAMAFRGAYEKENNIPVEADVEALRDAASAVFLAVEDRVAIGISMKLLDAANEIQKLREQLETKPS